MDNFAEDERWDRVMENMDILFGKMSEIEVKQQKLDTKVEMSTKVLEQMLEDQQLKTKKSEVTGQVLARLTINQMNSKQDAPPSPPSSDTSFENDFHQYNQCHQRNEGKSKGGYHPPKKHGEDKFSIKHMVPKMTFPSLMELILAFSRISVKAIPISLRYLRACGLHWHL
jgi:hypothetical protein